MQTKKSLLAISFVLGAVFSAAIILFAIQVKKPEVEKEVSGNNLESLFTRDLIDVQIAYLENKIGPAKWAGESVKTFELRDGCLLETHFNVAGSVVAVGARITPECNVNVGPFIGKDRLLARGLTFGNFGDADQNVYYADCLGMCGNAFEPSRYSVIENARVLEFIDVAARNWSDYEGANQWWNLMVESEGQNWVQFGNYNCGPNKYNNIARKVLSNSNVEMIYVGRNLPEILGLTSGCTGSN